MFSQEFLQLIIRFYKFKTLYLYSIYPVVLKNKNLFIFLSALSLLTGCRVAKQVTDVNAQKNISIAAGLPEDPAASQMIAPYKKSLEQQMNARISHTSVDLNKQGDNSSLGNLLADFTLNGAQEWAKKNNYPSVDAAVINSGGIRSTIGVGDILLKHVYEVMPFENELVLVKMKGSDLNLLFSHYLETQKANPVSGLTIETASGALTRQLVGGKPVDPQKTYFIATSDFLALGGDGMKFFGKGEMISTGIKLRDLYIEKFRAMPEVAVPADIRLQFHDRKK